MSLLDFLRGAGKTAKVSSMLARDRCVLYFFSLELLDLDS